MSAEDTIAQVIAVGIKDGNSPRAMARVALLRLGQLREGENLMAQFDDEDLKNRFAYHPPTDDATKARHEAIRGTALAQAIALVAAVPPGRELALALTALEESMFWANAGIARIEPSGRRR